MAAAAHSDECSWFGFVLSVGRESVGRGDLADRGLETLVGLYICEGFLITSNNVSAKRQASA